MEEIREVKAIVIFMIEKLLQWIYATRNKKSIHKLVVTLVVVIIFIVGLSLILYIIEMGFLINRHLDEKGLSQND